MRIGILGGTFDPVHLGHLILASEAKEQGKLDRVIFMPAKVSPFKQNCKMAEDALRLEMLKKSVAGIDGFKVSDFEMELSEVSYTVNTLMDFRKSLAAFDDLYFILGTDAFLEIEKWYESETLLREFKFIVGNRPGYRENELELLIDKLRNKTEILKLKNRLIEISSTEIKEKVKKREKISFLVTKEVEEYIDEFSLYKS